MAVKFGELLPEPNIRIEQGYKVVRFAVQVIALAITHGRAQHE